MTFNRPVGFKVSKTTVCGAENLVGIDGFRVDAGIFDPIGSDAGVDGGLSNVYPVVRVGAAVPVIGSLHAGDRAVVVDRSFDASAHTGTSRQLVKLLFTGSTHFDRGATSSF